MADLILLKDFLATQIELWKPVEGHHGYEISTLGNVRTYWVNSNRVPRATPGDDCYLLKPSNERGYLRVTLNGKTYRVHRLVALAFVSNARNLKEVNHRNGIKGDNRADNLEWSTRHANVLHAHENGLVKYTLAPEKVREIRRRRDAGEKVAALAKEFGITRGEVSMIAHRKVFKFVEEEAA